MTKRDLRKQILGQLATKLRKEIIIDDIDEGDINRADDIQRELAREFERRAAISKDQP